jgi:FixJ family two-component response regulator
MQLPEGVTAFLEKPYRVDHFLVVVERTMRGVA